MSKISERDRKFVEHLKKLKHGHNGRWVMAALRRALGKKPGEVPDAERYILSFLRPEPSHRQEHEARDYYLVASLFASNLIFSQRARSFGASMRELVKTGERDLAERRFIAVLGCSLAELPDNLRHMVGLLKSKSMAIDWAQLLADIRQWEDEGRQVQSDWARAFWSEIPNEGEQLSVKPTESEDAM